MKNPWVKIKAKLKQYKKVKSHIISDFYLL